MSLTIKDFLIGLRKMIITLAALAAFTIIMINSNGSATPIDPFNLGFGIGLLLTPSSAAYIGAYFANGKGRKEKS
jgi:hypothetical protein